MQSYSYRMLAFIHEGTPRLGISSCDNVFLCIES